MKKILMILIVFTFLCLCSSGVYANLLVNGGAEDGSLNGWTTSGYSVSNDSGQQAGDWYFKLSSGLNSSWLMQTGSTGLNVGDTFELTGWYKTDAYDWGEATISFFDSDNNYIDGDTINNLGNTYSSWYSFNLSSIVPTGAASWEITLTAHYNSSYGSVTNVDWDTLSLEQTPAPVPVPATMLLLGSGLIGLMGLRKKTRKN